MPESLEGYICQHCGWASHNCEAGDCSHSPVKKHVYIARKDTNYICKYCGWEPTRIIGGECNSSPHAHHEFM